MVVCTCSGANDFVVMMYSGAIQALAIVTSPFTNSNPLNSNLQRNDQLE
jgi:hypothetical protein